VNGPRVLITSDVVGGVWDFALTLGSELRARHDARITLLALGEPSATEHAAAVAAQLDFRYVPVKLEWMADSADDVGRTAGIVAHVARSVGADVVHANQFAAACAELHIPVVLTVHSDVLSWSRWTRGTPANMSTWASYAALVREALLRADAVTAVSGFLAGEIGSLYDVRRPVEVIHNGWPHLSATSTRRDGTLLAGRVWDEAKNFGLVSRAAVGWEPGSVLLAGEARHPESGALAEIGPLVRGLGFLSRDELLRRMADSAIFLSPARYDPFGLLPLQAALSGCALLLSDIPSYRELWQDAAVFFRSDDAADLRARWRRLLERDDERAEVQRRAMLRACTKYTSAGMSDRYAELYARTRPAVAA
jgi:glycosyltransferase involved in cell wall biosynthesis